MLGVGTADGEGVATVLVVSATVLEGLTLLEVVTGTLVVPYAATGVLLEATLLDMMLLAATVELAVLDLTGVELEYAAAEDEVSDEAAMVEDVVVLDLTGAELVVGTYAGVVVEVAVVLLTTVLVVLGV